MQSTLLIPSTCGEFYCFQGEIKCKWCGRTNFSVPVPLSSVGTAMNARGTEQLTQLGLHPCHVVIPRKEEGQKGMATMPTRPEPFLKPHEYECYPPCEQNPVHSPAKKRSIRTRTSPRLAASNPSPETQPLSKLLTLNQNPNPNSRNSRMYKHASTFLKVLAKLQEENKKGEQSSLNLNHEHAFQRLFWSEQSQENNPDNVKYDFDSIFREMSILAFYENMYRKFSQDQDLKRLEFYQEEENKDIKIVTLSKHAGITIDVLSESMGVLLNECWIENTNSDVEDMLRGMDEIFHRDRSHKRLPDDLNQNYDLNRMDTTVALILKSVHLHAISDREQFLQFIFFRYDNSNPGQHIIQFEGIVPKKPEYQIVQQFSKLFDSQLTRPSETDHQVFQLLFSSDNAKNRKDGLESEKKVKIRMKLTYESTGFDVDSIKTLLFNNKEKYFANFCDIVVGHITYTFKNIVTMYVDLVYTRKEFRGTIKPDMVQRYLKQCAETYEKSINKRLTHMWFYNMPENVAVIKYFEKLNFKRFWPSQNYKFSMMMFSPIHEVDTKLYRFRDVAYVAMYKGNLSQDARDRYQVPHGVGMYIYQISDNKFVCFYGLFVDGLPDSCMRILVKEENIVHFFEGRFLNGKVTEMQDEFENMFYYVKFDTASENKRVTDYQFKRFSVFGDLWNFNVVFPNRQEAKQLTNMTKLEYFDKHVTVDGLDTKLNTQQPGFEELSKQYDLFQSQRYADWAKIYKTWHNKYKVGQPVEYKVRFGQSHEAVCIDITKTNKELENLKIFKFSNSETIILNANEANTMISPLIMTEAQQSLMPSAKSVTICHNYCRRQPIWVKVGDNQYKMYMPSKFEHVEKIGSDPVNHTILLTNHAFIDLLQSYCMVYEPNRKFHQEQVIVKWNSLKEFAYQSNAYLELDLFFIHWELTLRNFSENSMERLETQCSIITDEVIQTDDPGVDMFYLQSDEGLPSSESEDEEDEDEDETMLSSPDKKKSKAEKKHQVTILSQKKRMSQKRTEAQKHNSFSPEEDEDKEDKDKTMQNDPDEKKSKADKKHRAAILFQKQLMSQKRKQSQDEDEEDEDEEDEDENETTMSWTDSDNMQEDSDPVPYTVTDAENTGDLSMFDASVISTKTIAIFRTIQRKYPEKTNNTDSAVFLPEPYYETRYRTQTGKKKYIRMPGIIIDLTDTE